jgi:hypothetical protein
MGYKLKKSIMQSSAVIKKQVQMWINKRSSLFNSDKEGYEIARKKVRNYQKSLRLILKHENNMKRITQLVEEQTDVNVKNMFGKLISGNNRQTEEQELAKVLFCKASIELAGIQGATVVRWMGGKSVHNHIWWRKRATQLIRENTHIRIIYNLIKEGFLK